MRQLNRRFIAFFAVTHLAALYGLYYLAALHAPWQTAVLGGITYLCGGVALTAGYHRYYTHRSYRCARPLQLFFILFGAGTFQKPVAEWAPEHWTHHVFTDTERDPHNVREGFWWAHVGWLLVKSEPTVGYVCPLPDLSGDPLVRFEQRYYIPIALTVGFGFPTVTGLCWGDPLGGLLIAGFLKLVVQHHMTFMVNSVAHTFGTRPHSPTSARNNRLIALPTLGEGGGHNSHHAFPWDYRHGLRWYALDPTKWLMWTLSLVGLTWNLRRASPEDIRAAEIRMAENENR
ncbi:MAG: fatty acid desaturase [Patescibacteria group bacterium]|nr:fatty acid desaturase [Patescibacteria group bacterium]